jgi:hypothetical protein
VSPRLEPIASPDSFKSRAYAALKDAIVAMDVYHSRADIRLDERRLALDFGISRTPVREAMAHRLGRAREHGGPPHHRKRQRRGDRVPPHHVCQVRERRAARQA